MSLHNVYTVVAVAIFSSRFLSVTHRFHLMVCFLQAHTELCAVLFNLCKVLLTSADQCCCPSGSIFFVTRKKSWSLETFLEQETARNYGSNSEMDFPKDSVLILAILTLSSGRVGFVHKGGWVPLFRWMKGCWEAVVGYIWLLIAAYPSRGLEMGCGSLFAFVQASEYAIMPVCHSVFNCKPAIIWYVSIKHLVVGLIQLHFVEHTVYFSWLACVILLPVLLYTTRTVCASMCLTCSSSEAPFLILIGP